MKFEKHFDRSASRRVIKFKPLRRAIKFKPARLLAAFARFYHLYKFLCELGWLFIHD